MSWLYAVVRGGSSGGGGGAGVGHGLTPTHYVAPFASVSGASSDADAQNATAFSNASSVSTPCTLQCALVNATGNHIVECAPGVYIKGITTEDNTTALFTSYNSGTNAGAPLIFVAKYPAAKNMGNSALWSEPRRHATDLAAWIVNQDIVWPPLMGGGGIGSYKSHVIWDGFYFNEEFSAPSTNGLCMARGSGGSGNGIGIKFRRCLFDRYDWLGQEGINLGGNNYNCIQFHTCTDGAALDNYFRGAYDGTGSHNHSCITQYASDNYTFQNNTFDSVTTGIYIKGTGARDPYGTVKLNRFIDVSKGIACLANSATQDTTITQNLFYFSGSPPSGFDYHFHFDATSSMQHWVLTNNTLALKSTGSGWFVDRQDGNNVFRNNLIAHTAGTISAGADGWYVNSAVDLSGFGDVDFNFYWSHNGGNQFSDNGGTHTSIASWRTSTGDEGSSVLGTTPSFVNETDFRLSGGSAALTAGNTGGPVGYSITGSEEAGVRTSPTY